MELRCEKVRNIQVIHVEGRIDGTTSEMFGHGILRIIEEGNRQLLLDLTGVPYINSAGLRAMLVITKSLRKPGDLCAVCGLTEEVAKVIDLAGFSRILRIYPTITDAIPVL